MFRIWVPDLDSPSYFVAIAAVELGFFKQEGVPTEFVYNTMQGPELMREGIALLREKFARLDSIGPVWAAQVAQEATPGTGSLPLIANAVLVFHAGLLGAQEYPNKRIHFMVPNAPGNTADLVARALAAATRPGTCDQV